MDIVGKVFGDVAKTITDFVQGTVENIKDVASDIRPSTLAALAPKEVSIPVQTAQIAFDVLGDMFQSRNQPDVNINYRTTFEETKPMAHVVGHEDGELMVSGNGIETGTLQSNVISFGTQALQQLGRNALRNINRGAGAFGTGAATGLLAGGGMGDACGCGPKPFVRFDKCDRPIITRKMKKQAIEAVNSNGPEAAAAALTGGDMNLLTAITSKQFPPMRRGISGAQLNNAARTARKLNRMHEQFQKMCKKKK